MTDIPLPAKKYYPFLDGFRAVAIIWVLFYHVNKFFELDRIWGALAGTPLLKIINSGFLGVDIFFVISGFLITGLLIRDLNGKVRVKRFYSRRFFKIIPHYFAAVFVGLIITGIFSPKFLFDLRTILGYFFFYNNYLPRIPILSHMWSIAIEEHFLFCFAPMDILHLPDQ